ncbi:MAG: DUF5683 domain-containing protein [Bacteroidota bacterium]
MRWLSIFTIILLTTICSHSFGQVKLIDSTGKVRPLTAADSSKNKKQKEIYCDTCFSPRKATLRSAIIPGWGQVYNKQVWKVPFVYAILGVTAGIFVVNVKEYNGLKAAYVLRVDTIASNDTLIDPRYSVLSANSMKFYRDEYRKNVDLSVLVFIIGWGLNVIDATVSAHLKQFDVSDDLSLKIKPTFNMNGQTGVSLVFGLKNNKGKLKDMNKILNAK